MNSDDWRRKNAVYLHDPPLKHDALYYRNESKSGHQAYAAHLASLLEHTTADSLDSSDTTRDADHWTSSADRPQLGHAGMVRVGWRQKGLVTHPLDDAPLHLLPSDPADALRPSKLLSHASKRVADLVDDAIKDVPRERHAEACWHALWRRLDSYLAEVPPEGVDADTWERLVRLHPADTRTPDHSLRDHARMSSALAPVGEGEPWLFRFTIGPVGAWIRASRTTRDLWTASFLLSEISFAAMRVVIDRYGPDAVIYPDLAFNVRMDRHLARPEQLNNTLPDADRATRTRAALIPNAWLAVVPEGVDDNHVSQLGRACHDAALACWHGLADAVRDGFLNALQDELTPAERDAMSHTWTAQCHAKDELQIHHAAIPWQRAMPMDAKPSPPRALPSMKIKVAPAEQERRARFESFVSSTHLRRYDEAAWTYYLTRSHAKWGPNPVRGMDYAPTWHLLHEALLARKHSPRFANVSTGSTTTCTVCGHRAAMSAPGTGNVDARRAVTEKVWDRVAQKFSSDLGGAERLCGVCATRRYLIPPWEVQQPDPASTAPLASLHHVWSNSDDFDKHKTRLRLPMPSTAAVAAAPWLVKLLQSTDPQLLASRTVVVTAAAAADWPRTFFARSLPGVARHVHPMDIFTELEPSALYAGPREAEFAARDARAIAPSAHDAARRTFGCSIRDLRKRAEGLGLGAPSSRFAVVAIDGDHLGDLVLGVAEQIRATWAEVLHPDAVSRLRSSDLDNEEWAKSWRALLGQPRLMGPSLHAFINRAVTTFSNLMVPWVVEHEFHGRLIYAGGDDILALAPAEHALPIAARLQQLWSAAWVLDTQPEVSPWSAAPPEASVEERQARFRVLSRSSKPLAPATASCEPHAWSQVRPQSGASGQLIPMLGRHQSVSAGIAYAHFKTPLGLVVAEAKRVLDEDAKGRAGRAACAEVLYTRSGPKHRSVFRWHGGTDQRPMVPVVKRLREGFRERELPGRLPYKLAEGAEGALLLEGSPDLHERWIRGSLKSALDGNAPETVDDLADLWFEGLRAAVRPSPPGDRSTRQYHGPNLRDVPGLDSIQLCRALASEDDDT